MTDIHSRGASPLILLAFRHLQKHVLQTALMVGGIILGVAVAVAIDLANASANRAFDLSVDVVTGRATHQITGGPGGLDEQVYLDLRHSGILRTSAPVITEYVTSPQISDTPLQLLGIDPFAEPPFRSYFASGANPQTVDLASFLTVPGALFISDTLAERFSLSVGDSITLNVAGRDRESFLAGLVHPDNEISRLALDGLILVDIATAQELTGRYGRIDRIDLIIPQDREAALVGQIGQILPESTRIIPADARSETIDQMTRAFRTNLSALSLLALVVGMFLIYNAMTFSVVRRRSHFGILRCLGVTRREIFALVTVEALIVGTLGALLGIGLGILLGRGTVDAVTGTIDDLYFTLTVTRTDIPISSLVKGLVLGITATLFAAVIPALEAATVPPRTALSRSGIERKTLAASRSLAVLAIIGIIASATLLRQPSHSLTLSLAATLGVIGGLALLTPLAMRGLIRVIAPVAAMLGGPVGRIAARSITASMSRTAVAVAALMVAISVTIGIGVMVSSFRRTVIVWLDQTLQSDVYIVAQGGTAAQPSLPIDPDVVTALEGWPGIARIDTLRTATVDSPAGPLEISATDNLLVAHERLYLATRIPPAEMWDAMQNGAVLISEPFANRMDVSLDSEGVTVYTDQGEHTFPVAGIYYDYSSSRGLVLMTLHTYRAYWSDPTITAIGLRLVPGTDVDQLTFALRQSLSTTQQLAIRPNQSLKSEVLEVFDRTFAITRALQIMATAVAFLGILSAFLSLEIEKQREMGILRALGLTAGQAWRLILIETGLMGALAGLLAMPTGLILSLILIHVINRRSFGWTLQTHLPPEQFAAALITAIVAAMLAGVYPARRITQTVTADVLRSE